MVKCFLAAKLFLQKVFFFFFFPETAHTKKTDKFQVILVEAEVGCHPILLL